MINFGVKVIVMRRFFLFLLLASLLISCKKRDTFTVVVSMDAFRWDYPEMFDTPNLDRIESDGLRTVMTPSYPASTFPNHYAITTGLVPDHNGIVNGQFWNPDTQEMFSMVDSTTRYNPEYFLGEPIWVTAQKQGVKTASVYWVGSDVAVRGTYPEYYHRWDDTPRMTFEERVDRVLELLSLPEDERPRLIMAYFDEPDHTGHLFGPGADETARMVHHMDSLMGVLYDGINAMEYADRINLIVTSDHGMTDISDERFINWKDYLKQEWCERVISSNPTNIFVKEGCLDSVLIALQEVPHISVWTHGNVPDSLNYGNSSRTGDVIVAPEIGWQFSDKTRGINGAHGYFPQERDMQVIFYAKGPSFVKREVRLSPEFKNIDIYPTLAYILNIKPEKTDGTRIDCILNK